MQFTEFGDGDVRVLFVLGWGNRTHHENVRWLVDELVDAGYTVDVGEIPDHGSDFEAGYVRPTQRHHDATGPDRILSHSTGGLVAAHLDSPARRVYLSPWWGMADEGLLGRVAAALPTDRPVVPVPFEEGALGDLATERQRVEGPDRIAPAFLRAVADAQSRLPDFRDDSVVFCSLRDQVVGVDAIGDHAPAERTVLYDGGHELFSSSSRERTVEWLLAVLGEGPGALTGPVRTSAGSER
ncbi:alpha/beta hydrolase [Halosimplex litoreum]|uniref:Alpha/beta hydrolase n=1 Tax=Halosimplex litoreum TaxID=1198301 RepID=A0A7T3FXH9_9EURY|nr:alpha/beta hydrolase [Halosimplex litoreum]QPV62599.1 alpha/beta hydrolase [Halosimplex litoreum]